MGKDSLTTTKSQVVKNQQLDDHFCETYGKEDFLSMFDLDSSNWAKSVKGEGRKIPKVYFHLMYAQQKVIGLTDALKLASPGVDVEELIRLVQKREDEEKQALKSENDRLKSALRMIDGVERAVNKIKEKIK